MDLLSVGEAAQFLGVSPQRVRALIGSKRLPAVKIGRDWALDRQVLAPDNRRGGRPVSADNAWALLALLDNSEAPWIDIFSRYRLRRRMLDDAAVVKALRFSEPRSRIYEWRVLPGDLPKLQNYGLVRSGLFARVPKLDIVAMDNGVDGYVSSKNLAQIEKDLQPAKSPDNPNVVLRVPSRAWVLGQGPDAPAVVVAADLLGHRDRRVARASRKLLHVVADR